MSGRPWTGSELYARQREALSRPRELAPAILAVGLRSPENMGGVLRVADAAGSASVCFVGQAAEPQRIRRVSRSTEALVPWSVCDEAGVDAAITAPLIGIELATTSENLFTTELARECTFVIGSERHGLSPSWLARCAKVVHLPMFGVNGSMNVTHALAIVLYEWRRRFTPEP